MPIKRPPPLVYLVLKIIGVVLYAVCWYIESSGYTFLLENKDTICIRFFEISAPIKPALFWINIVVVSDLVAAIGGLPLYNMYNHVLGIVYNMLVGIFLFYKSANIQTHLTYCGQPIQYGVASTAKKFHAAGIIHIVIAVLTLALYQKGECCIWRKLTPKICATFKKKLNES